MMYIPLNIKTDYSLLCSLIKIDDLIKFLHGNKITSCGICDNNLSGSIEFYNKCIVSNIKPIIGLEIKYNDNILLLYAENFKGYKNLLKLNTLKEQNEISLVNLEKYNDNIICVLPCKSIDLFDDLNFYKYLYIGYNNSKEKLSGLFKTQNIVYINPIKAFVEKDLEYLEYLNLMGGNNDLKENCYYFIPNKEDQETTISFANLISLEMPKNKRFIPIYDKNKNSFEFLKALSIAGLNKRLKGNISENYLNRLEYELNIIKQMNFVDYFLIVYDYVLYAKKSNILVGPGRGSAAGSLVCYSIGITDIDPIEFNLLFERFLNPDRITMPDIDIDFDSTKRDQIIEYVKHKYGEKYVALGLTYNTLKAKLVIRDLGKILKIDDKLIDKFSKNINRFQSLKDNLNNENIKKFLNNYEDLTKLYKIALKLEGLKKNISTHAAGVVISSIPLDEAIPIKITENGLLTGITMDFLEDLGLLKMDFLGLKNLTIIANILNQTKPDLLKNINLNDAKVLNVFKNAKTDGIFQYETFAMKSLLLKLKPNNFEELVAAVALVRPGPSEFLDEYILRKEGKKAITYLHPLLESILKETYGIILYQEQIINILVVIGGFTKAEADVIRRAISKKKENLFLTEKEKFINGALKNDISNKTANEIFNSIIKFSGYGFNKSHSVAYALIGYQMAYLKVYYPVLFMNELLKDTKDINLINGYLTELKQNHIKVIKPDVNISNEMFIVKNNELILPLTLIKGITKDIGNKIISNQPYEDYFSFVLKNKDFLKSDILKKLINSGALGSFNQNNQTLVQNMEMVLNYAALNGLGEKPILTYYSEYSLEDLQKNELELFGFYVGNHPASKYSDKKIMKLKYLDNNLFKNIICVVTVDYIKTIKTKHNDNMAFLSISDETGKAEAIVFSDKIKLLENISKNDLVLINGKTSKSFDKIKIIVNNIIKEKVGKQDE